MGFRVFEACAIFMCRPSLVVSIPKRVSEFLKLSIKESIIGSKLVSIPKRVSEFLKRKFETEKSNRLLSFNP